MDASHTYVITSSTTTTVIINYIYLDEINLKYPRFKLTISPVLLPVLVHVITVICVAAASVQCAHVCAYDSPLKSKNLCTPDSHVPARARDMLDW